MTLLLFLLSLQPAHAQDLNLSLSPPLLQATIKPGKSISQVFTIYNNSPHPIKLTPKIIPFLPEDDQGNPGLQPQFQPAWLSYFSLANSKIFLNQPFALPANSSDQLILNIKIPPNAPQADHYATLLVSSEKEKSDLAENLTSISASIGANILLTVASQADPATILKVSAFKPLNKHLKIGSYYILDNLSPIQFSATAANTGNHLAQIHGLLQVTKGGKNIATQPSLPTNILARSSRVLTASSSSNISFTPKITNTGTYKASLNIRSHSGSTQTSINLILLPLKATLGIILSIILLQSILKKTTS